MDSRGPRAYEFIARAILTEAALDRAGRHRVEVQGDFDPDVAKIVSLERFDDDQLTVAKRMAAVYAAISCFENSSRRLIIGVLTEKFGKSWWKSRVTKRIQDVVKGRMEKETVVKWHTPRGGHPVYYTDMGHMVSIVSNNWEQFEPYIGDKDWFANMIKVVEISRNIIMHSGSIADADVYRLGTLFRDWIRQVGG